VHPTFVALTLSPSPKAGEGFRVRAPLLPKRDKGLGDEGKLAKLGCTPEVFGLLLLEAALRLYQAFTLDQSSKTQSNPLLSTSLPARTLTPGDPLPIPSGFSQPKFLENNLQRNINPVRVL
jgi:hypothetical protein